jgi:hypothetical protein
MVPFEKQYILKGLRLNIIKLVSKTALRVKGQYQSLSVD